MTGAAHRVVINAPQVVAAAGSLETPALLLRSGIGGPAVGTGLRTLRMAGAEKVALGLTTIEEVMTALPPQE